MTGTKENGDLPLGVARVLVDQIARACNDSDTNPNIAGQPTMDQTAQFVEISIQQAMRGGDFENLPGAGKPIPHLTEVHDPDWWIRQKIQREQITGLGPPALTLRNEDAALDARLDATGSERTARELIDDFNTRVIHARRQLQGGPPVVTPTRDMNAEVSRWRKRRTALQEAADKLRAEASAEKSGKTGRWKKRNG